MDHFFELLHHWDGSKRAMGYLLLIFVSSDAEEAHDTWVGGLKRITGFFIAGDSRLQRVVADFFQLLLVAVHLPTGRVCYSARERVICHAHARPIIA